MNLPNKPIFVSCFAHMASRKNILPPPIDPKKEPITVAVLTGKLDSLFSNVKELVDSTARRSENVLRKEIDRLDLKIDGVEKRLSDRIDGVENDISGLKGDVKDIKATVHRLEEKFDNHESRLSTVEEKLEAHLTGHP